MSDSVPNPMKGNPGLRAFNVVAAGFLLACVGIVLSGPGMLPALHQISTAADASLYLQRAMQVLIASSTSVAVLAFVAFGFWAWLRSHYSQDEMIESAAVEPAGLTSSSLRQVTNSRDLAQSSLLQSELEIAMAEIKRLRVSLEAREQTLAEFQQSQSRIVSRVSHGLRTPLNGIVGMADMLFDSDLSDEQRNQVGSILTSAGGLVSEVDSLIDFARFESGELRLERSRFDLRQSISDVCEALRPTASAHGVGMVFYADEDLPSMVDGDGKRLRHVVRTLVENAIRHTEQGEIVVRAARLESNEGRTRYRVDVQDSGRGIAPEDQLVLWKAFANDDASEAEKLGPALRVTSALVRLMGGKLLIQSRLGEGTRFTAEVMLGDATGADEPSVAQRSLDGVRALIVDDNMTNLTVLEHQLNRWNIDVTSATSGPEALELLSGDEPAFTIGIFDLNMPEMDGLELARRVNGDANAVKLPILMLTSSEIDLDADDLDSIGVQRNLSKPPKSSDLRDTLASMVAPVAPSASIVPLQAVSDAAPVSTPDTVAQPSSELLDLAALDAIRERQRPGKPDVVARAVTVWLESVPVIIAEMERAQSENDHPGLSNATTSLISSSKFVGAKTVASACQVLEEQLKKLADAEETLADQANVADAIAEIASACQTVTPELEPLAATAA